MKKKTDPKKKKKKPKKEIDQIQESLVCFHSRQSYKDSILGFVFFFFFLFVCNF